MNFFRLTREKPSTGLITIRPDDEIMVKNISSNVPLLIEFSTTDGTKESMELTDEISLQNSAAYLRRAYFRMEVMIAKPHLLTYRDEVHCKLDILY
jgi:hypothetical protein